MSPNPFRLRNLAACCVLALAAPGAQAVNLGAVMLDNTHARASLLAGFDVVYLDCTGPCIENAQPFYDTNPPDHPTIVARILHATANYVGLNERRVTLYSARGYLSNVEAWLATPVGGNVTRAQARGVRVFVDTTGDSPTTMCPSNPTRVQLRAVGVAFVQAAGNDGYNGMCGSPQGVVRCEANSFSVAGIDANAQCGSGQKPYITAPLWAGSNFLADRTPYAASVQASAWGVGEATIGTSWSAPGVGGGWLAIAARRPHARAGVSRVDEIRDAIAAASPDDGLPDGNGVFDSVSRGSLAAAANASSQCDGSITYPEDGFYYDPDHPGNGLHLVTRRTAPRDMHAFWYTYRNDGTPVWYYATDTWDANAPKTAFDASLVEYHWNGPNDSPPNQKVATAVGNLRIDFCKAWSASLRWNLPGRNGVEPVKRFEFDTQGTRPSYAWDASGLWYDPQIDGAGYSIESQHETDYLIYFHYADDGRAVWGSSQYVYTQQKTSYAAPLQFFNSTSRCPGCANPDVGITPYAGGGSQLEWRFTTPRSMTPTVERTQPAIHWPRPQRPGSNTITPLL